MPFFSMVAEAESVIDSGTLTTIINASKEIIGLLTTPPLGVFIGISVVGSITGLVCGIVAIARGRRG